MAINFSAGFNVKAKESIDQRLVLSKAEMRMEEYESDGTVIAIPDNYICLCKDDNRVYVYNSNNDIDVSTGKFRLDLGITVEDVIIDGVTYKRLKYADSNAVVTQAAIVDGTGANIADSLAAKEPTINASHKISSTFVDDSESVNKFVTASEKNIWNNKQSQLTAGDQIVINNDVISATREIFWCSNSTTLTQVREAIAAGKICLCLHNSLVLPLVANLDNGTDNYVKFATIIEDTEISMQLDSSGWGSVSLITFENAANKATTISDQSTDVEYASAQSVYEYSVPLNQGSTNAGKILGIDENGEVLPINKPEGIFYCTYGTTTYSEISAALAANKLPVCLYSNKCYVYCKNGQAGSVNYYYFSSLFEKSSDTLSVHDNTWSINNIVFESSGYKVQSISSSSTVTEYPSAKCVYDNLLTKVDAAQGISNANKFVVTDNNGDIVTENRIYTSYEDVLAVKGDLIQMNLDGTNKTYRVINRLNGTVVEVMTLASSALTPSYSQGPLPSTGIYENSELDTYLNVTWYNTLSSAAKAAIIDKTIKQDQWALISSTDAQLAPSKPIPFPIPVECSYLTTYTSKVVDESTYYISSDGTYHYVGVGLVDKIFGNNITRHIYTVGMQDIIDYIADPALDDGKLIDYNSFRMFQGNVSTPVLGNDYLPHRIQLLSAGYPNQPASGVDIFTYGGILFSGYGYGNEVCPVFQIDLSKIEYIKL